MIKTSSEYYSERKYTLNLHSMRVLSLIPIHPPTYPLTYAPHLCGRHLYGGLQNCELNHKPDRTMRGALEVEDLGPLERTPQFFGRVREL
jgi:hypothetical protein